MTDKTLKRPFPTLKVAAGAVAVLVSLAGSNSINQHPAAADPDPGGAEFATVSADLLPAPQINGIAWVTRIVGNTAFVGGKFSSARPFGAAPGVKESARGNILAFDLKTGVLKSRFAPKFNGEVKAMAASADGKTLYVGGLFTKVDGADAYRIAAFDVATGKRVRSFSPYLDYRVAGLAVHGGVVYAVGKFNTANRQKRPNAAAFNRFTGAVLPWNPRPNAAVAGVAVSPSGKDVVIAGQFSKLNGAPRLGWAATSAATGSDRRWPVPRNLTNHGVNAGFTSVRSDRNHVYLTGYSFDKNTAFEGTAALRWKDGSLENINGSKGDHYDAAPAGGVLYAVGHAHDMRPIGGMPEFKDRKYRYATALTARKSASGRKNLGSEFGGMPAPDVLHWYPDFLAGKVSGQSQAIWSVDATSKYVVVAGEFPFVNGRKQYGIARFGTADVAPLKEGVRDTGRLKPEYSVNAGGQVSVKFHGLYDRDSRELTYELLRGNEVVDSVNIAGLTEWRRGSRTLVDRSAPNGTHRYAIRVYDSSRNRWQSERMPITVAGALGPSEYRRAVKNDGASTFWRLDEGTGKTHADDIGHRHLFRSSLAARVFPGAVASDQDGGNKYPGVNQNEKPIAVASRAELSPSVGSFEVWFKTTSQRGGMILSFGDSKTQHSRRTDRNLLIRPDGKLQACGGDQTKQVVSPRSYNDGAWHHAVVTMDAGVTRLSVDGKQVVAATGVKPTAYRGYWRLGSDNTRPWHAAASNAFVGSLDNAAIYPKPLSPQAVKNHYDIARGLAGKPSADFDAEHFGQAVMFNGKNSVAGSGKIVKYSWDFGDGKTATGWVRTHVYQKPGKYTVKLTVVDSSGRSATRTRQIEVSGTRLVRALAGDEAQPHRRGTATKRGLRTSLPDPKKAKAPQTPKKAWRGK